VYKRHSSLRLFKSISTSALYVNLPKYFSHPSLVIYFFANRWELLLGNHLDGQSKTGSSSQIIFITLFSLASSELCCDFYQPQQTEKICWRKTIFLSHNRILNFNVQGHILSSGGDAVRCLLLFLRTHYYCE